MRIDKRVLQAASRMRSPEMAPLVDWLRKERSDVLEMLTTFKPDGLQVLQGRAQQLADLLDLIERADKELVKLEGR